MNPEITKDTPIYHDQEEAFKDADFVYTKNWSSYDDYGKIQNTDSKLDDNERKIGEAQNLCIVCL